MKSILIGTCVSFTLLLTACGSSQAQAASFTETAAAGENHAAAGENHTAAAGDVNLTAGDKVYQAGFYENETAKALMERMPMELDMEELHGNEKYYYLPDSLPTNAENIGSIHAGDIMLFGSDCLVLFYEDFQTTFRYTRIGYLENPAGLSDTLGSGSVKISFDRTK